MPLSPDVRTSRVLSLDGGAEQDLARATKLCGQLIDVALQRCLAKLIIQTNGEALCPLEIAAKLMRVGVHAPRLR